MRIVLAVLLACMLSGPAGAEEEVAADLQSAIAHGFEIMIPRHESGVGQFARDLDRVVVRPFMRRHAPGVGYSFSYWNHDINDDGFGDVVIALRTPAQLTAGMGGPVLIVTAQGGGWSDSVLDEAIAFGVRERRGGYGYQLALISESGYRIFGE